MGKGLNLAAAVLSGALACVEAQEQEVVDPYPESQEVDTCATYAHDRALDVCGRIFCSRYMLEDVTKIIEEDCAAGNVPEPGSDMDQCDKRGLTFAATVYRTKGELGQSAERLRSIENLNCLRLKGHTGENILVDTDRIQDAEQLAKITECERASVEAALSICAPERLCSQKSLRMLLEGFLRECYGKQGL